MLPECREPVTILPGQQGEADVMDSRAPDVLPWWVSLSSLGP